MKLILIITASLIGLLLITVAIISLLGARLPREHVASRSIQLHKPPDEIYAVVHDFASMPKWRNDVERVDVTIQSDGRIHFRETGRHGVLNFEVVEDVPGERMVTRIIDTDLGYSGKWTYVFATEKESTRLTITEHGEVSNVLFRFLSKHIFGHTATIDGYLSALARHFGESSTPK
ncbi:MAG TPA: SRPBCC family protein [Pyrinomonadaceae bacterium]|nr:SRPBCC family protein [Pyrinomonadaceae bacterium]